MKNYLKDVKPAKVQKFQAGGGIQAPAEGAPQGGPANMEAMIMQAYESQDPEMALQVVNTIVESMSGGQAPAGPAPEAPQDQVPMGRYGMKIPKVSLK